MAFFLLVKFISWKSLLFNLELSLYPIGVNIESQYVLSFDELEGGGVW